MTPIRTMYHVSRKSCKIDHTFSINFDPSKKWLDGWHWMIPRLIPYEASGLMAAPQLPGTMKKKILGFFSIYSTVVIHQHISTRPTHQFLNYTEICWNFRVGISLDEFPPHKIEMPKKIGAKIQYVKQNFARTHLVRISQILMNHWRVLKNTPASILHDRIPKQTSPVYSKIYLFVKLFLASGYFQIHPPQVSTCARERCITNPSPPNSHLGFMDTALRREPGTWTPAMAPKCFNKNQKNWRFFSSFP